VYHELLPVTQILYFSQVIAIWLAKAILILYLLAAVILTANTRRHFILQS
jgi:hypothetical protein